MQTYKIVRRYYRDNKAMESGSFDREYVHPFTPLTLREAETIKSKFNTPKNCIDHIELLV